MGKGKGFGPPEVHPFYKNISFGERKKERKRDEEKKDEKMIKMKVRPIN